jgi:hypothetical protein
MPVQQNPLRDNFEKACQQTEDPNQREFIALDAVGFLIKNTKTDFDKDIQKEIDEEEKSSDGLPPLPDNGAEMNDDLCANIEARLANFLAAIARLKKSADSPVVIGLFARAKALGQKVDAWRRYDYWVGLAEFLQNSTTDQWRLWRSAALAQQKARFAIADGDFTNAKLYAVYGLQKLAQLRDHKLYLDLCSRLENAIAEGQDACWRLATALGNWVIKESVNARHYLREVGMRHNLGNQLLIAGKIKEAMAMLQQAQESRKRYSSIQDMDYYYVNLLERLARAYLYSGGMQKAADYLEQYEHYAQQPREKTLLWLGKGYAALVNNLADQAEQNFEEARKNARGPDDNNPKDFFNLWSALVSLGLAGLKRKDAGKARNKLDEARQRGRQKDFLNNPDRKIHDFLVEAEIFIENKQFDQAEGLITNAKKEFDESRLDSPRRQIQWGLTNAYFLEQRNLPGDKEKAQSLRKDALDLANAHGFYAADIDLLKTLICG